MKRKIAFQIILIAVFMFSGVSTTNAGFILKKQNDTVANQITEETYLQRIIGNRAIATSPFLANHVSARPEKESKGGILAYLALGCGVLGLAIASPQTTLIMMLLGLAAGVFGKVGLKVNKKKPFLRLLCYIGIILGVILIAFATVPLLFIV